MDFYRNWIDYKHGFGPITGEHWLGNDVIHSLTQRKPYMLRIDFELWNGTKCFADYSHFKISDESDNYRLQISGYTGTAGDSMIFLHNNRQFSTPDRDNDDDAGDHCSQDWHGAWWYNHCYYSHLNGLYWKNGQCSANPIDKCVRWTYNLRYKPIKSVTMIIKGELFNKFMKIE